MIDPNILTEEKMNGYKSNQSGDYIHDINYTTTYINNDDEINMNFENIKCEDFKNR